MPDTLALLLLIGIPTLLFLGLFAIDRALGWFVNNWLD